MFSIKTVGESWKDDAGYQESSPESLMIWRWLPQLWIPYRQRAVLMRLSLLRPPLVLAPHQITALRLRPADRGPAAWAWNGV